MLGLLCQSAIGDSADSEFLLNSEQREPSVENIFTWDAVAKAHNAKPGEQDIGFEFRFHNKTGSEVQIKRADSSCLSAAASAVVQTLWRAVIGRRGGKAV